MMNAKLKETLDYYIKKYGASSQEVKDLVALFAVSEFVSIDEMLQKHLDQNKDLNHEENNENQ